MMEDQNDDQLTPMKLRNRTHLTQVEFARIVGRSPSTIAKWEAGEFVPKLKPSETKQLCEAYQCSLEELIEAFEGKELRGA